MSNRKLIGILLLVLPWLALILVLSMYAVSSFVTSQLQTAISEPQAMLSIPYAHAAPLSSDQYMSSLGHEGPVDTLDGAVAANIMNVGLGFLGIIAVLGILIGTPVGIYLIATSTSEESGHHAGQPKPLQGQYKAFMIFAGTTVVMSAIGAVLNVYEYARLKTTPFDLTLLTDPSPVSPVTMVGSAVGGLAGLAFIISAIIYLFWLGRAARNLSLHHHMKSSPDWLVWGHIIPIYNLVHPILTYPAFWREVAAAHHTSHDDLAKGQQIIIGFYIFDLLKNFGGQIAPSMNSALASPAAQTLFIITTAQQLCTAAAGIFIMLFVKMVTDKMEA